MLMTIGYTEGWLEVAGEGERPAQPKYTPEAMSEWPPTERPEMGMLAVGMPS